VVLNVPLFAQEPRVTAAAQAALTLMRDWFGPLNRPTGAVPVRLPWLAPARDQQTERLVIDGIVRDYWTDQSVPLSEFGEIVVAYVSAQAIHQQLEGSNFETVRFFGGSVPFPLRSVLLSPPVADPRPRVWRFDDPGHMLTREMARGVRALQTIERYVGWPAMLETLSALRAAGPSQLSAESFGEQLSQIRGTDMRFLINECFRPDATYDYAVAALKSEPGAPGLMETTVTIVRAGTGRFALEDDGESDAAMPMMVRFADGSEFRDLFDGAAPSATMVYSAKSAAVSAIVDPDAMLLLDVNRDNNAIVRDAPTSKLGIRLAMHWLAWLQNAMLSYTALV